MTNAYYISGHGLENHPQAVPSFVVPPGCVIVVLAHKGEVVPAQTGTMAKLCSFHSGVLKNPLEFTAELTATFLPWGALAFYKEGDVCPNFVYDLEACYNKEKGDFRCERFGSGVLSVDLLKIHGCERLGATIDTLKKFEVEGDSEMFYGVGDTTSIEAYYDHFIDKVIYLIGEMYVASIYPAKQYIIARLNTPAGRAAIRQVFEEADDLFAVGGAPVSGNATLEKAIKTAQSYIRSVGSLKITQQSLCQLVPGVYYNFVCRTDPDMLGSADKLYIPNSAVSRLRYVRDPTKSFNVTSSSALQRNHMRSHITESFLHRKAAIRNYYEGKSFRKDRAKRNFSHFASVKEVSHRNTRKSAAASSAVNRRSSKKGGRRRHR